eukprot:1347700-Amorphochlora_amoeboformis.AAC.1
MQSYRLAISANGEYSQYHGNTYTSVQSYAPPLLLYPCVKLNRLVYLSEPLLQQSTASMGSSSENPGKFSNPNINQEKSYPASISRYTCLGM